MQFTSCLRKTNFMRKFNPIYRTSMFAQAFTFVGLESLVVSNFFEYYSLYLNEI